MCVASPKHATECVGFFFFFFAPPSNLSTTPAHRREAKNKVSSSFSNYKETQISEEKYSSNGERRNLPFLVDIFNCRLSACPPALKKRSENMSEKVFNNEAASGELLKYKHVKMGRGEDVNPPGLPPRWGHENSQTHDGFIYTLKRKCVCVCLCVCVRGGHGL